MKRSYLHLLIWVAFFLLLSSCTKEDEVNIQEVDDICTKMNDINFMKFCYTKYDVNNDSKVTMTEASAVYEMDISGQGIQSLTGIEYFTNLKIFACSFNELTSLDVSNCINLSRSGCINNLLTTLDVSKCVNLSSLYCEGNPLSIIYMNVKHKDKYFSYPEGAQIEYLDL